MEQVAVRKGPVERLLAIFAEVKPGEAGTALLLTLDVFLILAAYYIIKPIRETLILSGGGAELKTYMSAFQTGLLLLLVPAYARLASKLPRRPLINAVTLFFVACMGVFALLAGLTQLPLGVAFFLWVGVFNVMVVAQFWSFANDLYTPEQGKRLFAIVAFGASSGAVLGPMLAKQLFKPLGVPLLLVLAALILVSSLILTNVVDTRERRRRDLLRLNSAAGGPGGAPMQTTSGSTARAGDPTNDTGHTASQSTPGLNAATPASTTASDADEPLGNNGAYRLVFGNRYLLLIALLILFLNWVNTNGEYILSKLVVGQADALAASTPGFDKKTWIGQFYSDFFTYVNAAGLIVQLFLVSRILKYLGVRTALLILPVIAFTGYALAAFLPVLPLIRWTKTAENATDYSLQNTLRGVLFLPTTREQKYKAKQAIDTIFVRAGDALSALLVFVGTTFLAFQAQHFAMVNLVFVVIWIALAIAVGVRYRKMTEA